MSPAGIGACHGVSASRALGSVPERCFLRELADARRRRAEELLGSAIAGIRRESVIVCSKVGLPMSTAPQDRGLSRKRVITSCRASLRRLRTGYLDLYQAHRFDGDTPLEETITAFSDLVHAGDVRCVGVSEWTSAQLREGQRLAWQAGIQLVSNQPQYSVLWRVPEAEVMPTSSELGIGQIAYSPLAQGVLTGKYPQAGYLRPDPGRIRSTRSAQSAGTCRGSFAFGSRACGRSPMRPAYHSLSLPSPGCFITAMSRRP